jgi:hypothetical protein
MHYLVIERFRNGDAAPVYARFREQGRLETWMSRWADLVEFEVHPVMSSAEAVDAVHRRR